MNQQTIFEDLLNARKRELTQRLTKIEMDLDQPGNPDSQERASEREGDEVLESLGQAGLAELRAIDAALKRMAAGSYGICVRCGGPISPERLKIVPHAALCQECIGGS